MIATHLEEQWAREEAITGRGRSFDDYAFFVAINPWVFGDAGLRGPGSRRHLVREAQDTVRDSRRAPQRWEKTGETTPSGKVILRCKGCGSEGPLAICRARCSDESVAWPGWQGR